mmetsp:Transcript_18872/g.35056  ORF Transcript_18872/g.35056 Transcript_18872/m.35056 type:complete len:101 (+) Transcript_18872:1801-2103(+)
MRGTLLDLVVGAMVSSWKDPPVPFNCRRMQYVGSCLLSCNRETLSSSTPVVAKRLRLVSVSFFGGGMHQLNMFMFAEKVSGLQPTLVASPLTSYQGLVAS